jgi:2-polyprenyl-3-methyl-5-hydroxy-6-metoxy-1,4-benzoquinol methylase
MTAVEEITPRPAAAEHAAQARDELVGRLFGASLGAAEVLTVYLGDRLGLYAALRAGGPATAAEVAIRAGTNERYTLEWLEQQAVAGLVEVDDTVAAAGARRYTLPAGHAEVLLEQDSLAYLAPLVRLFTSFAAQAPALVQAFRTGEGVPYTAFGADARDGQALMNRPAYERLLAGEWLPQVPDVHARLLRADPPARVADLGCGAGWASIAIARAYPHAQVDGFDADPASIELARTNAREAGVADRVRFDLCDVSAPATVPSPLEKYDLALALEMIHDLGRPVEALRNAREYLAEGGALIVMDERVAEQFTAPGDDIERFMYAASVLFCLPTGLADAPSVGTGTVMRPDTLRAYAQAAGFRDLEVLPIQHDFWRFYRLHP